jgi:hypothetical protein
MTSTTGRFDLTRRDEEVVRRVRGEIDGRKGTFVFRQWP